MELEAGPLWSDGGHRLPVLYDCAGIAFNQRLDTSFKAVQSFLGNCVSGNQHQSHRRVCVFSSNLLHRPCVRGVGDFEYACPLKWPISMTMVVMVGMPTRHLKNCDVERVFVIFFELQNVLASFHVENRDICVSGTIRRILDDLLRLCMAVVVVAIFVVAVVVVVIVAVVVVAVVVVVIVVIPMLAVVIFVSKRSAFEWAIDKQITEVFYQH